jgi:serine/threonine-protein kinase
MDGAPGRKLTKTGMIFGTPEYMSPEQAAGKELDHRVDVYALGIILYECLAGRVPFEGDTFMGVLTQHLFAELPPIMEMNPNANVTPELELVIRKALAKDPDDRYQDTEELAEAVTCALDGRLSRATVKTPPSAFGRPSLSYLAPVPRRKTPRWVWAAVVSVGVAAIGWVALGSVSGSESGAEASEAQAEMGPGIETSEPVRGDLEVPPDLTFVNVHVATEPTGARIILDDGLEACAKTPCTLETKRGATLVIRAKLGKRRGRTAITPTQEETVLIELQAPKKAPPKPRKAEAPKRNREQVTRSSDLKVPEWAQ